MNYEKPKLRVIARASKAIESGSKEPFPQVDSLTGDHNSTVAAYEADE
jgi:hypothetical protein